MHSQCVVSYHDLTEMTAFKSKYHSAACKPTLIIDLSFIRKCLIIVLIFQKRMKIKINIGRNKLLQGRIQEYVGEG